MLQYIIVFYRKQGTVGVLLLHIVEAISIVVANYSTCTKMWMSSIYLWTNEWMNNL